MRASWFYGFATTSLAFLFPLVIRWTVEFRAPLPSGPVIVMVNHSGFLDPALVNNSLKRRVIFLAKQEKIAKLITNVPAKTHVNYFISMSVYLSVCLSICGTFLCTVV